MSILSVLGPVLGDIGGAFLQDHLNRSSAKTQMQFQEQMSSSAYQRAADDLEKAGLNRILAVGNPASSPAGSALSTSVPALGQTVTNARVADANIDNVKAQTDLTRTNTAKAAAETAFVQQQTAQSVAETAFKNFMVRAGEGKLPHEIQELVSRSGQQSASAQYSRQLFKSEQELTRLRGYEADQQQVMKAFYQLAQPLIDPILKYLREELKNNSNNANDASAVERAADALFGQIFPFRPRQIFDSFKPRSRTVSPPIRGQVER